MGENKYERIRIKIEDCYSTALPMGDELMLYLLGMAMEEVSRRETELSLQQLQSVDEENSPH